VSSAAQSARASVTRARGRGARAGGFFPVPVQPAVDDFHHPIHLQLPAQKPVQLLGERPRVADRLVVADAEEFHVAFDFHEEPDVVEMPLVVRARVGIVDGVGLLASLQHHVLRLEHLAEIALAQNHLVVVLVRQRLQQVRDDLDRLAARCVQPGLVLLLREALDALDFEVAQRIVFVGLPLAVRRHRDAAGLQHAHHHRGAGARQAGHDDHCGAEPQAPANGGEQAHSTYPSALRCSRVSGSNS
jgi:hypothetical protein